MDQEVQWRRGARPCVRHRSGRALVRGKPGASSHEQPYLRGGTSAPGAAEHRRTRDGPAPACASKGYRHCLPPQHHVHEITTGIMQPLGGMDPPYKTPLCLQAFSARRFLLPGRAPAVIMAATNWELEVPCLESFATCHQAQCNKSPIETGLQCR